MDRAIIINNQELINMIEPGVMPRGVNRLTYKFTIPRPSFKFLDVYEGDTNGQLYGCIHG